MSAALPEIAFLLAPLDGPDPCGADLGHDPAFLELERTAAGKPERQYGDKLYPAEPPDWPSVLAQAMPLAQQTRDLRVAVWLLRCATRIDGLAGAAQGLLLVGGLLQGFWPTLHPALDAEDNNDPTMRLNALAPLTAPEALISDLRQAGLAPERNSLTLRDLELAFTRAKPAAEESKPTEDGVQKALAGLAARHPGLAQAAHLAHQAAQAIAQTVESEVGAKQAPNLAALLDLLALPLQALARLPGQAAAAGVQAVAPAPPLVAAPATGSAQAGPDTGTDTGRHTVPHPALASHSATAAPVAAAAAIDLIHNRDDAIRALERICVWIEHNEPSHPAPLLIRRAQRLMNKRFIDIIRDLAPDALPQFEQIAGPDAPT